MEKNKQYIAEYYSKEIQMSIKRNISRLAAILIGLSLSFLLIESALRMSSVIPPFYKKQKDLLPVDRRMFLFAGDSWTQGADADKRKGFFDLLKKDDEFKDFSLVNVGYGSNNSFQIVSSIINSEKIPSIIIVNMGINSWHLIGLEKFFDIAKDYFLPSEARRFSDDFKIHDQKAWLTKLKTYKLYCYLVNSKAKKERVDMKILNKKLGSGFFWKTLREFKEKYYSTDELYEALPGFLRNVDGLHLDEKVYFCGKCLGFNTERMEQVLKKADLFYPEKLSVISWDTYERLDSRRQLGDTEERFIKWSFMLLKKWSDRNDVTVFIQTYPDIERGQQDNPFERVNKKVKLYASANDFKIIDHNASGVSWEEYRTCWHVNSEGHEIMKSSIKKELLSFLTKVGS